MLDKLSKQLLNFMLHDSDAPSKKMYNFGKDLKHLAVVHGTDPETIRAAVRNLESENYVKYVRDQNGKVFFFMLDHKGLHFQEYQMIEWQEYLKKSVFTPITVTILTTIALHWLPTLLRWILTLLATPPAA